MQIVLSSDSNPPYAPSSTKPPIQQRVYQVVRYTRSTYYKKQSTTALNSVFFQMLVHSSQTGSLSWLDTMGFVSFSSTRRLTHLNSQVIWKNLLIYHNYGCLKLHALNQMNPAIFKTVFLQLTRLGISFEIPYLIYKAGEQGCTELKSLLIANGNRIRPERILFSTTLPFPSEHKAFVTALVKDTNKFKEMSSSPLLQAIYHRDTDLVRAMLAYDRAHADVPRYMDPFALKKAIEEGTQEIACLLIQPNTDVERPDHYGTTLLMNATNKGELEIVRLLIENNANVNAVDRSGHSAHDHSLGKESLHQEFAIIFPNLSPALERQKKITQLLVNAVQISKKHKKIKIDY